MAPCPPLETVGIGRPILRPAKEPPLPQIQHPAGHPLEKGVEDYDKLKRFLFTTASTNTVQYDEEKALSTHRYGKWYRGTLVFALIAIWTILGVVFPWRIWTRGVTAADLDSLGLSALLIVAGVLWAFTVASEVPFVMKVDREGIREPNG